MWVPANQIHDFHSSISPEGLYWVMLVPSSGTTFSSDDRTATLPVSNAPIIEQLRWLAMDPLDASKCDFAVMGTAVNGKYYEAAKR